MKTYTKHGFLYYELTIQQNKPAIIIYSDKETKTEIFRDADLRKQYTDNLNAELVKGGTELFQVPQTAVWYNPTTLLSVRTVNDRIIVLEFPWGFEKQLEFTSTAALRAAYASIKENLDAIGIDPDELSAYLLKAEAASTYLKIADAAETYANKSNTETALSQLRSDVDTAEGEINSLTSDVTNLTSASAQASAKIEALEAKTENLNPDGTTEDLVVDGSATFTEAPVSNDETAYAELSNDAIPNKTQVDAAIAVYTPKIFNSVTLTSSVNDGGDANYPWLNTFAVSGIDATYIPTVILSSAQVVSGEWSSIAETSANAVMIRTKSQVAAGTSIPQIICQKS